jgi:hypothetical protein
VKQLRAQEMLQQCNLTLKILEVLGIVPTLEQMKEIKTVIYDSNTYDRINDDFITLVNSKYEKVVEP